MSIFEKLKALIGDGNEARAEESAATLDRLMQLDRIDRQNASKEDIDLLTDEDRLTYIKSFLPVNNITVGVNQKTVNKMLGGALGGGAVIGLIIGATILGSPNNDIDPVAQKVVQALGATEGTNITIATETVEQVAERLALSSQSLSLGLKMDKNKREFDRIQEILEDSPEGQNPLVDIYNFMLKAGPDGLDLVRFIADINNDEANNSFYKSIVALLPNDGSAERAGYENLDVLKAIIGATAQSPTGNIALSTRAGDRVDILKALARVDADRRDAILKVLGASEEDIDLIAREGLPLPLSGDQRDAYKTILGFKDRNEQSRRCKMAANLSATEWSRFEWSQSPDGKFAKQMDDIYTGTPDKFTPAPCVAVFEPGTPEWRAMGGYYRIVNGERVNIRVCASELPDNVPVNPRRLNR